MVGAFGCLPLRRRKRSRAKEPERAEPHAPDCVEERGTPATRNGPLVDAFDELAIGDAPAVDREQESISEKCSTSVNENGPIASPGKASALQKVEKDAGYVPCSEAAEDEEPQNEEVQPATFVEAGDEEPEKEEKKDLTWKISSVKELAKMFNSGGKKEEEKSSTSLLTEKSKSERMNELDNSVKMRTKDTQATIEHHEALIWIQKHVKHIKHF